MSFNGNNKRRFDTKACALSWQAYRKKLNQVLQNLNAKLAAMAQGDEGIVKVTTSVSDKLVAFKTKPAPLQKDMISICNDPFTLAQQLTHIELVSRKQSCGAERCSAGWDRGHVRSGVM